MVNSGLAEGSLSQFDFTFVSDKKAKLERLRDFIVSHYPYTVEEFEQTDEGWELSGITDDIATTADTLMYWALDMAKRGYEFDARFDAYGASVDADPPRFPDVSASREDFWFDLALEQYNSGNLSGALISWSHVIAINPRNADAWYSRAIVKNELHTWKSALRDYDEALRIAPRFMSALVNRGSLRADHGDHEGAMEDYAQVIEHASDGDRNKAMAYFNRGNSKLELSDKKGACEDWKKARDLGSDSASARIDEHCD
jgi:tetratricopeptide (TPR) repeat protein